MRSTGHSDAPDKLVYSWTVKAPGNPVESVVTVEFLDKGPEEQQKPTSYPQTISTIAARDLSITVVYIAVLLLMSWIAFRRAQVAE